MTFENYTKNFGTEMYELTYERNVCDFGLYIYGL
jgi:hypothetical protein